MTPITPRGSHSLSNLIFLSYLTNTTVARLVCTWAPDLTLYLFVGPELTHLSWLSLSLCQPPSSTSYKLRGLPYIFQSVLMTSFSEYLQH